MAHPWEEVRTRAVAEALDESSVKTGMSKK